jgi:hypothetical protein
LILTNHGTFHNRRYQLHDRAVCHTLPTLRLHFCIIGKPVYRPQLQQRLAALRLLLAARSHPCWEHLCGL